MKQHHSCPAVAEKWENWQVRVSNKQPTILHQINQHLTCLTVHYLAIPSQASLPIWTKTEVDVSRNSRKIGPKPIPATPHPHPVTQKPPAEYKTPAPRRGPPPCSLLILVHRPHTHLTLWPFRSLRTLHSFEVHRCSHSFLPTNSTYLDSVDQPATL